MPVPRQGVGIVIGKGGEMIKKIQSETGAKVQFKQGKYTCTLSFMSPFQKISKLGNFVLFFS